MSKIRFSFLALLFLILLVSCTPRSSSNSYPADSDNIEFATSSGIEITTLSDEQVENLVVLGKIWGFLKYYHPAIAKGNYNWDYELFRIIPKILNADSKQQRDLILIDWIEKLGSFKRGKVLKENENRLLSRIFLCIGFI